MRIEQNKMVFDKQNGRLPNQRNLYIRLSLGLNINQTEHVSLSSNDRKDRIDRKFTIVFVQQQQRIIR